MLVASTQLFAQSVGSQLFATHERSTGVTTPFTVLVEQLASPSMQVRQVSVPASPSLQPFGHSVAIHPDRVSLHTLALPVGAPALSSMQCVSSTLHKKQEFEPSQVLSVVVPPAAPVPPLAPTMTLLPPELLPPAEATDV